MSRGGTCLPGSFIFWVEGNHRGWSSVCPELKPSLELVLLTGGTQTGEHWVERCRCLLTILNFTETVWGGHLFKNPPWSHYHSLPGPLLTWPLVSHVPQKEEIPHTCLKTLAFDGTTELPCWPPSGPCHIYSASVGILPTALLGGCLLVSFRWLPVWVILANHWNALMDFNN